MEQTIYSEKDIETSVKIFHRAIEIFKIPDEPTNEEAKEKYTNDEGLLDFGKVPVVTIKTWNTGLKFLNLVYFYDGFFTVYADYNPTIAILGFIDEARKFFKLRFPNLKETELEEWTEVEATKMTFSLISRFYQRMNLSMRNFTDEVIRNWVIEWHKWERQVNNENGIKSPLIGEKTYFRVLTKEYENEVVNFWFNNPKTDLREQKIQLAREYPSLLKHWEKIRKDFVDGNPDWREYANAGKFIDTPNDLIDLMETSRSMSHLALEQAGRRANLVNPKINAMDLEKRQQGIAVTGYTPRRLNDFKDEGIKFMNEMEN